MSLMLWEQIPREIPIMSALVQPVDLLNLLNTATEHSTCCALKSTAIITDKVSFLPMNIYLRSCGRALIFNFEASFVDGFMGSDS